MFSSQRGSTGAHSDDRHVSNALSSSGGTPEAACLAAARGTRGFRPATNEQLGGDVSPPHWDCSTLLCRLKSGVTVISAPNRRPSTARSSPDHLSQTSKHVTAHQKQINVLLTQMPCQRLSASGNTSPALLWTICQRGCFASLGSVLSTNFSSIYSSLHEGSPGSAHQLARLQSPPPRPCLSPDTSGLSGESSQSPP